MKPSTLLCASLLFLLAASATPVVARQAAPVAKAASPCPLQTAKLINDYRQRHGLGPLSRAEDLTALASEHATHMASKRQLTHEGFKDRARRTGSRICVENVGRAPPVAELLVNGWRRSPKHDVNLLDPEVSFVGIAADSGYVAFFACSD